jgi:hypothetical protein
MFNPVIDALTEWPSSAGNGASSERPILRGRQELDFMDAKVLSTTDADYRPQYRQTNVLTSATKTHDLAVLYY